MADDFQSSTVDRLEAEVDASRARLANILDALTSAAIRDAIRNELTDLMQEYKDEFLMQAQKYRDELQSRARDTGRQTMQDALDDLKQRAMNNPLAVTLIGAGLAWRLYQKPPITALLVGAGAAMLMTSDGSNGSDRRAYRDPYREVQPRGYVPGGVAGYGYPVEEEAPGSSRTERTGAMASNVGETAREAGARARQTASAAGSRVSDAAARAASGLSDTAEHMATGIGSTAERAAGRAGNAMDMAQRNPLVLGAIMLATGVALGRRLDTPEGERLVGAATDALGRGARDVASRARSAARTVGETAGDAASSAAAAATGLADTAMDSAADVASGASHLSSSAYRSTTEQASHAVDRVARTGHRIRNNLPELVGKRPLLFGAIGLAVGAAAGGLLRSTRRG